MTEAFFRSLADEFARNRAAVGVVELALLVLLALGVALQLAALARRWWRRRTRLHQLAARLGIGEADLAFASGLAAAEGVAPLALLTRVDVFERATARALLNAPAHSEAAERSHRLRRALGFDRLPAHTPLLTTRELAPGTAVELGPLHGQVAEVGELSWALALPGEPRPAAPGDELVLGLIHAREARYELRCRLVERRGGPEAPVLVLAHDESPRRIQQRDYARVATRTAIALQPVPPWPPHAEIPVEALARLEDVSGGGALVTSRAALPVGLLVRGRFSLRAERFEGLPAVVLSSEPLRDGGCRARLEWGRLTEAERSRLVAAVAHLELLALGDAGRRTT